MHSIVLIGHGSIGERHYNNLRRLGCKIVAIADPKFDFGWPGFRDAKWKTEQSHMLYADPSMCLRDHAKDNIIVIASPTEHHWKQFIDSDISWTKGVFIEKPIFHFYSDNLSKTSYKIDIPVAVGHNYRFHPVIKGLKNTIVHDRTATLVMIAYDDVKNWPTYSRDSWLTGEYGGALLTSASHSIDTALYLLGPVHSVWCKLHHNKKLADSDTGVDMRLMHDTGAMTAISIRWEGPKTSTLAYVGKKYIGAFNMLAYKHDMHLDMMKSFLDYVDGKPSEVCTLSEGLDVMKVIDACRKSNGKVTTI